MTYDSVTNAADTAPLRLYLLGHFRIVREATEIHLPRRKVKSLISFLVLHPEPHARGELMALLWGNSPDALARHSLRTALATLRQYLGSDIIFSDLETVQLNSAVPVWVDVREMLQTWLPQREYVQSGIENLSLSLAPYNQELLAELYDEWIAPERERLRQSYIEVLLRLAQEMRSRSEYKYAIELAEMVLVSDPANERAHQHLMFCHMARGDRTTALAQYEMCERSLREELGVSPAADTSALYVWIKRAQNEHAGLEARITNLPIPLTSFVGRKRETVEVARLLGPARLLTLTGAGGSGKTRLAIQVATNLLNTYQDGVWWVGLAALTDEARLPEAIAALFGLKESQPGLLAKEITDFLRPRRLLLVLDNCEHLLAVCTRMAATLLGACPFIQILATSREALSVLGETIYQVPTLPSPDYRHLSLIDIIMDYDGVRLFVDRAGAAKPGFVLSTENLIAVTEICFRLDGIPLAIELAAARLRLLPVQEIAARLDDRFNLLTFGNRGALPRHQTLQAAIDWSYDSLAEPEKMLFRRLSVFVGGFTLEAAEKACNDALITAGILPSLLNLVNKSLLIYDEHPHQSRYRMLETIRQYARGKLQQLGEFEDIRRRHLEYFLVLAEEARPNLDAADRNAWLDRLESERDNLQVALQTAAELEPSDMEIQLTSALSMYWLLRAPYSQGRHWLEHSVNRFGTVEGRAARARALGAAGQLAGRQGDIQMALAWLTESVSIRRSLGDRIGLAESLSWQGLQWLEAGQGAAAQPYEEEAVSVFRLVLKDGDKTAASGLVAACHLLGRAYHQQGNLVAARPLYEESLELSTRLHDKWKMALPLLRLGHLARDQGNYVDARRWYVQALAVRRETGDRVLIANALMSLADLERLEGDLYQSDALYRDALPLLQEIGNKRSIDRLVRELANLALAKFQFPRAARLFAAAAELGGLAANDQVAESPTTTAHLDTEISILRKELGEEEFAAQWTRGTALSLAEIVDWPLL